MAAKKAHANGGRGGKRDAKTQQRQKLREMTVKKVKSDPGVPNFQPLKAQLDARLAAQEARKAKQSSRQQKDRVSLVNSKRGISLASIANDAEGRAAEYESKSRETTSENSISVTEPSMRSYFKELKKVIERVDVVLEVLDARDPMRYRSEDIEEMIMDGGADKKIVIVLNKTDLVPKSVVQQWLKYFRSRFPTVAFKASTQQQKSRLGTSKANFESAKEDTLCGSESVGTAALLEILKSFTGKGAVRSNITAAVIGWPNVGKSSVINSLQRNRVCAAGGKPGVTKAAQTVRLDKHISLLDTPGVVFGSKRSDVDLALCHCVAVEALADPFRPVEAILERCHKQQIKTFYGLSEYDSCETFLTQLALKRKKYKRGGAVDLDATARTVLRDWHRGAVPFYSLPPTNDQQESVTVVDQLGDAFDIDSLLDGNQTKVTYEDEVEMQAEQEEDNDWPNEAGEMEVEQIDDAKHEEGDTDSMGQSGAGEKFLVTKAQRRMKSKHSNSSVANQQEIMTQEEEELNPRLNQKRKKILKEVKRQDGKLKKKNEAGMADIADALSALHVDPVGW